MQPGAILGDTRRKRHARDGRIVFAFMSHLAEIVLRKLVEQTLERDQRRDRTDAQRLRERIQGALAPVYPASRARCSSSTDRTSGFSVSARTKASR